MDKNRGSIIKGEAKKPTKLVPQFLLNFSGYKHDKRLVRNLILKLRSITPSGVQKLLCTISGSRDISKS